MLRFVTVVEAEEVENGYGEVPRVVVLAVGITPLVLQHVQGDNESSRMRHMRSIYFCEVTHTHTHLIYTCPNGWYQTGGTKRVVPNEKTSSRRISQHDGDSGEHPCAP